MTKWSKVIALTGLGEARENIEMSYSEQLQH